MTKAFRTVLTIAGSDSSGGAGIQADIKTFAALECFGLSVITALTAQNTTGVNAIYPLTGKCIREQFWSICGDITIDAVKIGMLGSADAVIAVSGLLRELQGKPPVIVGGMTRVLAELKAGDVFGEEALISDAMRNATVVMKSNGVLLRLKKQVFLELMQEPLLRKITYLDAQEKVNEGAIWLDVRHPPEFRFDKLPNAINIPLNDVRHAAGTLSKEAIYIAYCQSGRRSAAAAFLLVQAGYKVEVLENGLWSIPVFQPQ